jgi:hypothetical protein
MLAKQPWFRPAWLSAASSTPDFQDISIQKAGAARADSHLRALASPRNWIASSQLRQQASYIAEPMIRNL